MINSGSSHFTVHVQFKYVRDRSEDGEFFLEISHAGGTTEDSKLRRRICVIDIESIDPQQGTKFVLTYHAVPRKSMLNRLKSYYKNNETTLRTETYESRQIANIMDGYLQVMKLYDEQERELNMFLARSGQLNGENQRQLHDQNQEDEFEENSEQNNWNAI